MKYIIVHLEKSKAAHFLISDFLARNDILLSDPFSQHVNVLDYAGKLNDLGDTFVLIDDNRIAGIVSGYINDLIRKEAYLQIIIVAKEAQSKGFGSLLIHAFINQVRENFATGGKVFLTVDKSNTKAESIYQHLGFRKSGRNHHNPDKQIMEFIL